MKKLENILKNEPKYRLKQVKKVLFSDLIENWQEATILSKDLRQKLKEAYPIPEIKNEKLLQSKTSLPADKDSQTTKALFKLTDGLKIESVLMRHEDGRNTVCVSSQAGCSMGCLFCATGSQGFKRNLTSIEIIGQIMFFARHLKNKAYRGRTSVSLAEVSPRSVSNVVFMGMGEPFLNYDNVLESIKILNDKDGFNLGARHISVSTCGITEGIEKLTEESLQVNLAISLHAPNNELRQKLMPINKNYPIEKILTAVNNYIKKSKRKVMFEYLMIDGVNDSEEEAKELAELLAGPLKFVNLISFNNIGHSKFKPSPGWKIKKFKKVLETLGIDVTQRYRFGKEIKAACGQLATDNQ